MTFKKKINTYYKLTKPGIIRGNLISATAGFLLASKNDVDIFLLIYTLVGISLVIACGCVLNNYIDINIDKKMERTSKRALVSGQISIRNAIIFAKILGVLGILILATKTNLLTAFIGLVGLIFYVIIYGIAKRRSVHGTLIGSISGALPPVAGYVAVTGNIDTAAILLFVLLAAWQMPHFYAIAIYRSKDYKSASIPVLPVARGVSVTIKYIIYYVFLYLVAASLLSVFGYTGLTYLIVVIGVGLGWLWLAIKGLRTDNSDKWAKGIFRYSLIVLLVFSLMISINSLVP